jgi:FkbM family methyltransferase
MTIASYLRKFEPILRHLRPTYRRIRTNYLRWRYPTGGFVTATGIPVYADFDLATYVWYDADLPNLAFDKRIITTLVKQSSGSVFVDIGAHFGYYSALFAELTRCREDGAKIIAVEPDLANFKCLERTIAPYKHVVAVLLQAAATDVDGQTMLFRSSGASCLHSFGETAAEIYSVPSIRLDTVTTKYVDADERIALVKVDIDGAEATFLRGAVETFAAHRPIIFIEFSPANLFTAGVDARQFLDDLCSRFIVYSVAYSTRTIRRVAATDYAQIKSEMDSLGSAITDLIASPFPLDLSALNAESTGSSPR